MAPKDFQGPLEIRPTSWSSSLTNQGPPRALEWPMAPETDEKALQYGDCTLPGQEAKALLSREGITQGGVMGLTIYGILTMPLVD